MKTKTMYCRICDKRVNAIKRKEGVGCGGHASYVFLICLLCFGALIILPIAIPFIMLGGSLIWMCMFFYDNGKYRCYICESDKLREVG
jgi:hypothetical protein